MAKYTFRTPCTQDVYTKIAEDVEEATFIFSVLGRLILQDDGDVAPEAVVPATALAVTGFMPVVASTPYNLNVSGMDCYFLPYGISGDVSGVKR